MPKQINRLLLMAFATLAVGCTPVAHVDVPAADQNPVIQRTTQWSPGTAAWPTTQWWTAFNDPVLTATVERVIAGNPSVQMTRAHASAATAIAAGQHGQLAPQVGIKAAPGREQISANGMFPAPFGGQTFTLLDLAGSLSYRLDLWGTAHAQAHSRDSEAAAAREDATHAVEAVTATAARVYFELSGALVDQGYVQEMHVLVVRNLHISETRAASGLDNDVISKHVAADTAAAAVEVATAQERVARARAVLAALAGTGPDSTAQLTPSANPSASVVALPQDLRLGLLARRADVRAARDRVEAVAYTRLAAQRAYLPDLSFDVVGGLQSRTLGKLFESGSRQWNVGPVLTLPLFDGQQRKAASRAQDAMYDAARAQYQDAVVHAVEEVTTALAARESVNAALIGAQRALIEEKQSLTALQRRYAAGIAAEADVVLAQLRVIARERDVAKLVVRSHIVDVDLIEALGGDAREEAK